MIHRYTLLGLAVCLLSVGWTGCAGSTRALTEYGYSSWRSRAGINSKGEFERARGECLEQHGIADPASVERDSPAERRFAKCMRVKGWCSNNGSCR